MRRNQKGFALLLEMLIVCIVMAVLAAIAVPNLVQVRASFNQQAARERVETVSRAQSASALCTATPACTVSIGVNALIPAPGVLTQRGYLFTYTVNPDGTWSYIAAPVSPGVTGHETYAVDQTGTITCGGQPC
jgi:type II secretory pathway pseudopilin PulG